MAHSYLELNYRRKRGKKASIPFGAYHRARWEWFKGIAIEEK
jgi:hypothetical protein